MPERRPQEDVEPVAANPGTGSAAGKNKKAPSDLTSPSPQLHQAPSSDLPLLALFVAPSSVNRSWAPDSPWFGSGSTPWDQCELYAHRKTLSIPKIFFGSNLQAGNAVEPIVFL